MQFTNDAQLEAALVKMMTEVIRELSYWIYNELKDSIDKKVYGAGNPTVYNRQGENGGLMGSFEMSQPEVHGRTITSEVFHDPMSMNHDPDNFIHGSSKEDNDWSAMYTDDIRENLIDIIIHNDDAEFSAAGSRFGPGWWRNKRDFWTPITKYISGEKMDRKFRQLLRARGIKYVKLQ